jgi:hypothetical protein
MLDHMFFINKPINDAVLSPELIDSFKKDFNIAMQNAASTVQGVFMSPFESDEVRNSVSKNSCVLVNSNSHDNSIVRVEVPHYEKCERIPLRRSPIFASHNSTILFDRTKLSGEDGNNQYIEHEKIEGQFDLYRLRFNCMFITTTEEDEIKEDKITADFIDISIAHQNDFELIEFWNNARSVNILEKNTGIWVVVPDITTCINDLYKMLNLYECPENKREKREAKYVKMLEIASGGYYN